MHAVVVGSGPAALSCIKALLRHNVRVTVLDAGEELDSGRQALVEQLSGLEPDAWPDDAVRRLTENPTIQAKAIPKKLAFGSDFIYAEDSEAWPFDGDQIQARGTFARGGFSTVWGGAMLPADDCDMQDWPIGRADLRESYQRVLADLPLSGAVDDLASAFPLYKDNPTPLRLEPQARSLLQDVCRAHEQKGGLLLAGQARLAVHAQGSTGCRYCGMCLSSCPYGAIYGTADEIRAMAADGRIEYVGGALVERFEETEAGVTAYFTSLRTGARESRSFDRAFVGAGAINSTRIILDTQRAYDAPIELLDSQKVLLPLLRLQRHPIAWPRINTLASLFIEAKLHDVSNHWIHMQISLVNDLVLRKLGLSCDLRAVNIPVWMRPAVERLMAAWCSLHSDHSSRIELRLSNETRGGRHVLAAREISNPRQRAVAARIARKIARLGLSAKLLCLAPLIRMSPTGTSAHYGGTFPMSADSGRRFSSDVLGRPCRMKRLHLIDASIFPSIPGTTMVLPIMANADRIATASATATHI